MKTIKCVETHDMPQFMLDFLGNIFHESGSDTIKFWLDPDWDDDISDYFIDEGIELDECFIIEKGYWT